MTKALSLIGSRQYVLDSEWGEVQPDAAAGTAFLERHSWDEYAAWHLGLTVGANDETKAATRSCSVTSGACTAAG